MKLTVHPHHFLELLKKSYTLDQIYLLSLIQNKTDVSSLTQQSAKVAAVYQGLLRKGLITEAEELTILGTSLLEFLKSNVGTSLVKKKPQSEDFLRWWKEYPGTDIFVFKNKQFSGTRTLRLSKEPCRIEFEKILNEGEYSTEQLITALAYDVRMKKEASFKSNENKLKYMQNSLTYLNQRSYEAFIELIETTKPEEQSPTGTTDI